jgi:hypothetical protein
MTERVRAGLSIWLLAFGAGIVAFALLYAVTSVATTEFMSVANTNATTDAQTTGIGWVEQIWTFLPFFAAVLLVGELLNRAIFEGGQP